MFTNGPKVCNCCFMCKPETKAADELCRSKDNWYKAPCKEAKCAPGNCWGCPDPNTTPDEE